MKSSCKKECSGCMLKCIMKNITDKVLSTQRQLVSALAEIGVKAQSGTSYPIGIDLSAVAPMVDMLKKKGYQITIAQFKAIAGFPA